MASPNNLDFPYFPPPPPHVRPPPPPPAPSTSNNTTVIVIVFVSFGGILFFGCLAFALCCIIKKRKKKTSQETDIVRVDEHLKLREATVGGPNGPRAAVLDIEDDVHVDEIVRKDEKVEEGSKLHGINKSLADHGGVSATALEAGERAPFPPPSSSSSSSGSKSNHLQIEHKA